ncbi:unnamed protein product [Owenia fusiformis]|uniref:Uncharacterized protein n=1 Tax=Owenia fusiformis TaxID=6347 RepID=A0A8J1XH04_OWEFU|nr:unnamed protein product [Owenia fusiformis]
MPPQKGIFEYIHNVQYGRGSIPELQNRCKASLSFIETLKLESALEVHNGCVNSICWNSTGEFILSGSDDQCLIITDPFKEKVLRKIQSGHKANIFSAKFLPNTNDNEIISCSGDGIICYTQLHPDLAADFTSFNCHFGTCYDVITVPNDSHSFLSCGEDGTVRWFDLRLKTSCSKETCKEDILINCRRAVTAISVNPVLPYQLAVGCSDSTVRMYDRRMLGTRMTGHYTGKSHAGLFSKFTPPSVSSRYHRITSLQYSSDGTEVLASFSSEHMYLINIKDTEKEPKTLVKPQPTSKNIQNADSSPGGNKQPPIKRLRLRGDWSDTGPNARPERERRQQEGETEEPQSNIMQRMSDMLTRWLGGERQGEADTAEGTATGESPSQREEGQSMEQSTEENVAPSNDSSNLSVADSNEVAMEIDTDNTTDAEHEVQKSKSEHIDDTHEHSGNDAKTEHMSCDNSNEAGAMIDIEMAPILATSGAIPKSTKLNSQQTQDPRSSVSTEQTNTTLKKDGESQFRRILDSDNLTQSSQSTGESAIEKDNVGSKIQSNKDTSTEETERAHEVTQTNPLSVIPTSVENIRPLEIKEIKLQYSNYGTTASTIQVEYKKPPTMFSIGTTTDDIAVEASDNKNDVNDETEDVIKTSDSIDGLDTAAHVTDGSSGDTVDSSTTIPQCLSCGTVTCTSSFTNSTSGPVAKSKPLVGVGTSISPNTSSDKLSDAANFVLAGLKSQSSSRKSSADLSVQASGITLDHISDQVTSDDARNNESIRIESPNESDEPSHHDSKITDNEEKISSQTKEIVTEAVRNDELQITDTASVSADTISEATILSAPDTSIAVSTMPPAPEASMSSFGNVSPSVVITSPVTPAQSVTSSLVSEASASPLESNSEQGLSEYKPLVHVELADQTPDTTVSQPVASTSGERRRRVGHSGPPTGDFQLYDDDNDSDEELMAAHRRSHARPNRSDDENLERNLAAIKLQTLYRKRLEAKEMEEQDSMCIETPKIKNIYKGHRNSRTMIKEASFWGEDYVMSGSDCGHIFIWDRHTAKLVQMLEADRHVVNCIRPHPSYPILASSGIDYDIKIWAPTSLETTFDRETAKEVTKRNEVMLDETRDTITVPASFMLRMLASLNHIRSGRAGHEETNTDTSSDSD